MNFATQGSKISFRQRAVTDMADSSPCRCLGDWKFLERSKIQFSKVLFDINVLSLNKPNVKIRLQDWCYIIYFVFKQFFFIMATELEATLFESHNLLAENRHIIGSKLSCPSRDQFHADISYLQIKGSMIFWEKRLLSMQIQWFWFGVVNYERLSLLWCSVIGQNFKHLIWT